MNRTRAALFVLALALLAAPAYANVGVPILALLWPAAWALLIVIIPLEAWVATRVLGTKAVWSLGLAVRANLASTAVGIPAVWGLPALMGFQDVTLGGILRGWGVSIDDRHYTGLALAAAAVLCVPCFLASVGVEYWVARRAVERSQRRRAWRWAWAANALSYTLMYVLAGFYFQSEIPSWYRKVWSTICITNLKVIGAAANLYQETHDGRLPPATDFATFAERLGPSWRQFMHEAVVDERMLRCPATRKPYRFNTALSGVDFNSLRRADETPMVVDGVSHADGIYHVLFADGHVRALRPDRLPPLGSFR